MTIVSRNNSNNEKITKLFNEMKHFKAEKRGGTFMGHTLIGTFFIFSLANKEERCM